MALSETKSLRRLEILFTDGQVNADAHVAIETVIKDGAEVKASGLSRTNVSVAAPDLSALGLSAAEESAVVAALDGVTANLPVLSE